MSCRTNFKLSLVTVYAVKVNGGIYSMLIEIGRKQTRYYRRLTGSFNRNCHSNSNSLITGDKKLPSKASTGSDIRCSSSISSALMSWLPLDAILLSASKAVSKVVNHHENVRWLALMSWVVNNNSMKVNCYVHSNVWRFISLLTDECQRIRWAKSSAPTRGPFFGEKWVLDDKINGSAFLLTIYWKRLFVNFNRILNAPRLVNVGMHNWFGQHKSIRPQLLESFPSETMMSCL